MCDEKIISVALCRDGKTFSLPAPARHGDCIYHPFVKKHWTGNIHRDEQGFLTNTGRYVDRAEAAKIAIAAGQIENTQRGTRLYSEDLW